MEIFYHLPEPSITAVVTIGNFDGVHCGHQMILEQTRAKARTLGVKSCVILFEPQPQEYFRGSLKPARLTPIHEKLALLETLGMDCVICLPFALYATLSAEDFIDTVLVRACNVRHLVIGDDFRFGFERRGDVVTLMNAGKHYGFSVEPCAPQLISHTRVSSSCIRELLVAGDFVQAAQFLGRPYQFQGVVIKGSQRARTLGFPTANIALAHAVSPLLGIYAVNVMGLPGEVMPRAGVANIGTRPTFNGQSVLLETHVLDFDADIYGLTLTVECIHKLRDEKKFESVAALTTQIVTDVKEAQALFKKLEGKHL